MRFLEMPINDSGVTPVCCGQSMQELVPNTVEASYEKHLPVIETSGTRITVKVGSVPHPMLPEHYIMWVAILTEKGTQIINHAPGEEPKAEFVLAEGDKLVAAYEYCNLHGLWKTSV